MKKALAETLIYATALLATWAIGYGMGELRASTRTRQAEERAGRWQGIADGKGQMLGVCLSTMGKR